MAPTSQTQRGMNAVKCHQQPNQCAAIARPQVRGSTVTDPDVRSVKPKGTPCHACARARSQGQNQVNPWHLSRNRWSGTLNVILGSDPSTVEGPMGPRALRAPGAASLPSNSRAYVCLGPRKARAARRTNCSGGTRGKVSARSCYRREREYVCTYVMPPSLRD